MTRCPTTPRGWTCRRMYHHAGPCALEPAPAREHLRQLLEDVTGWVRDRLPRLP